MYLKDSQSIDTPQTPKTPHTINLNIPYNTLTSYTDEISYYLCIKGFNTSIPLILKHKPSPINPRPIFIFRDYKDFIRMTKDQSIFILQDSKLSSLATSVTILNNQNFDLDCSGQRQSNDLQSKKIDRLYTLDNSSKYTKAYLYIIQTESCRAVIDVHISTSDGNKIYILDDKAIHGLCNVLDLFTKEDNFINEYEFDLLNQRFEVEDFSDAYMMVCEELEELKNTSGIKNLDMDTSQSVLGVSGNDVAFEEIADEEATIMKIFDRLSKEYSVCAKNSYAKIRKVIMEKSLEISNQKAETAKQEDDINTYKKKMFDTKCLTKKYEKVCEDLLEKDNEIEGQMQELGNRDINLRFYENNDITKKIDILKNATKEIDALMDTIAEKDDEVVFQRESVIDKDNIIKQLKQSVTIFQNKINLFQLNNGEDSTGEDNSGDQVLGNKEYNFSEKLETVEELPSQEITVSAFNPGDLMSEVSSIKKNMNRAILQLEADDTRLSKKSYTKTPDDESIDMYSNLEISPDNDDIKIRTVENITDQMFYKKIKFNDDNSLLLTEQSPQPFRKIYDEKISEKCEKSRSECQNDGIDNLEEKSANVEQHKSAGSPFYCNEELMQKIKGLINFRYEWSSKAIDTTIQKLGQELLNNYGDICSGYQIVNKVKFHSNTKIKYYNYPIYDTYNVSYAGFTINDLLEGYGILYDTFDEKCVYYEGIFHKNFIHSAKVEILDPKTQNLKFEGNINTGKREGYGKSFYPNGQLEYDGEFVNDEFFGGNIIEYYQNGGFRFKGTYRNGIKEGYGISYWDNQNIKYIGTYSKGKYHGQACKEYNEDGVQKFIGAYVNGCRYGYGVEYHDNNIIKYEGEYTNGHPCGTLVKIFNASGKLDYNGDINNENQKTKGFGCLYHENGCLYYEGDIINGKPNCKDCILYNSRGQVTYKGGIKEGKKEGQGVWTSNLGSVIFKGEFRNGGPHGKYCQIYSENGLLEYEGEMAEGKKENKGKEYHTNGSIWYTGEFKDNKRHCSNCYIFFCDSKISYMGGMEYGKKHDQGKLYDINGVLRYKGKFQNDKPNSDNGEIYNSEGQLEYEGDLVNGKRQGKGKEYHKNGEVFYENEFYNNKPHGLDIKVYNIDGNLEYQGEMIEGIRQGFGKEYFPNGKIWYEGNFQNNEPHDSNVRLYNKNGGVEYEGGQCQGKKEGFGKEYHTNQKLKYAGEFVNNLRDCKNGKIYLMDGILQFEGEIRKGEKIEGSLYAVGTMIFSGKFLKGKPISDLGKNTCISGNEERSEGNKKKKDKGFRRG